MKEIYKLAEHSSGVWQRRTALAVGLAAVSYTAGLLWSWQSTQHRVATTPHSPRVGLSSLPFGQGKAEEELPTLVASKAIEDLGMRVARLDAEQQQIYNYPVPKKFQGQVIKAVSVPGNRKVIALTFDDGPWPKSTVEILNILKKYEIKATFFVVGQNVKNLPEIAKKVVDEGHVIANHSWSHPYRQHSREAAAREIDRTDEIIYQTTGVKSVIFRPPGGILNNGLAQYAAGKKQVIAMWSADSQDYRSSSDAQIRNIMRDAGQGGVVLMHDGGGDRRRTVAALPIVIENLRKQGYEFVTLPELLDLNAKGEQQARGTAKETPKQANL